MAVYTQVTPETKILLGTRADRKSSATATQKKTSYLLSNARSVDTQFIRPIVATIVTKSSTSALEAADVMTIAVTRVVSLIAVHRLFVETNVQSPNTVMSSPRTWKRRGKNGSQDTRLRSSLKEDQFTGVFD